VPTAATPERVERYAFYTRTEKAFAIVMTSETRQYGNLLLKKGITHWGFPIWVSIHPT
jgi:L-fucose mutarotase